MARINLHSMQILSAVAAAKSFARAASELHMTASAVSKRIAELESRFGTPLLIRMNTGVNLTPAGEIVVRYSDELMLRVADMSREISDLLSLQQGEIRVMSNTTAILLGLLTDLAAFRNAHAGVRVHVLEGGSLEIADAVRGNKVDIGVCVRTDRMSGLAFHEYRRTALSVVVPEGHPLCVLPHVDREELARSDVIWTPPIRLSEGATNTGMEVRMRSFDGVLRSVRDGAGVAVVPSVALPDPLPAGLVALPLDISPDKFEVVVCHDASLHANALKQQLISWLASRHEQHPRLG